MNDYFKVINNFLTAANATCEIKIVIEQRKRISDVLKNSRNLKEFSQKIS